MYIYIKQMHQNNKNGKLKDILMILNHDDRNESKAKVTSY